MREEQVNRLNNSINRLTPISVDFSSSFTRPSNTDAYAAEDAVNNSTSSPSILTFSTVGGENTEGGKKYYVKSLRVATNNSTVTNGSFRLYITTDTQTAINDNSPQTLLFTNRANVVGFIDFSLTTGGSGSDSAEAYVTGIDMPLSLTNNTLYGYLVAKAAYVPASAQQFYFKLTLQTYSS